DLLALSNRRERDRRAGGLAGEIRHGHHGVPTFRIQLHDPTRLTQPAQVPWPTFPVAVSSHQARPPQMAVPRGHNDLAFKAWLRAKRRATRPGTERSVWSASKSWPVYENSERASQVFSMPSLEALIRAASSAYGRPSSAST